MRKGVAAFLLAAGLFFLYRATLLPSFDFGDTGSFQATVGSPVISPRNGYPLYFAIGNVFVWLSSGEPARALNLASAVEGAIAGGAIALAATELAGSILAGIAAALLFAGSYTFWSQAIIAEVYALHAFFVSLTLLLLLAWQVSPSFGRLAWFFAVYALGFGNHLSMILLAPGYAFFLLAAAPRGWRSMLRPRVIALAVMLAALGASQYAWNLRELWLRPHPPQDVFEALRLFWFDVTKSDWRDTMVAGVPFSMIGDRVAMYLFDLRQQFGWPIPILALIGVVSTWTSSWRRGVLMATLFLVNALFAFTYNVGDTHVFYLPSHLIVALLVAPGIVFLSRQVPGVRAAVVVLAVSGYALVRIYHDYPALDRSADRRPTEVLQALTSGLDDQHVVLVTDLNWQIQNGLSYFTKIPHPEIADVRLRDVLLYAPALVNDNQAIGREVTLTERAEARLTSAYGTLFHTVEDSRVHSTRLGEVVASLQPGTRYVLCLLKPSDDLLPDEIEVRQAEQALGGQPIASQRDYLTIAGVVGAPPILVVDSTRPFTREVSLGGVGVEIRMESWITFDTIRRMGFGHVIAGRRHTLIVERGLSFVAFDADGRAIVTAYASNIFEPQRRYLVRP